jgi:MoxR-like ATPase
MDQVRNVKAIISAEQLLRYRRMVENIEIKSSLIDYIAALVHATRHHSSLYLGASPRASLSILRTAKALAAMEGRDYVIPDDIRTVSIPVLEHRIQLVPERELEGMTPADVIREIIESVEVPR